jgi:type IV pilus assembly protein PilF
MKLPIFLKREKSMISGFFKLSHLLIILSTFIVISCSSKAEKKRKTQADLYYGAGTQSLMSQDYTDALTNLLKANELDPDNSGIINNLGMAYYFKGEQDLALRTLKRAIELDDKNSDAKVNLASIYFHNGNLNDAERIYKSVLKDLIYDKQARTLYNLGLLEMKRNDEVAAQNYFKKSVKEDANYCPSFFQMGLMQYNRKQFAQSLKNFKEASMGVCFESPAAHYYQGLSLTGLRRFNEARMKFDEIDARFKTSEFAPKARAKMMELTEIEKTTAPEEVHASRKVLESPDF